MGHDINIAFIGAYSIYSTYTPAFFSTSAKIGTVLLTGLLIIRNIALGHALAQTSARDFTMEALVLKRSSLVIPMGRWVGTYGWVSGLK